MEGEERWKALPQHFPLDDSDVKNELANLQSVYTQYVPLLDLGLVDDVEKTLDEFNKQAEAAGLQKIMDEAKTQVAAYLENFKNKQSEKTGMWDVGRRENYARFTSLYCLSMRLLTGEKDYKKEGEYIS